MAVARRLWRERVLPAWLALAARVGGALEECAFRLELAFDVLAGRVPLERERHWWARALEAPVLVDVTDWTNERLIFSVLIWPSLESESGDAGYVNRGRVDEVKEVIAKGAPDRLWCTRFDTDYGLRWDGERRVWTATDGFAYAPPASPTRAGDAA